VFGEAFDEVGRHHSPKTFDGTLGQRSSRAILNLAKVLQIGFKSGLYGGKNINVAPAISIASRTPGPLVAGEIVHDHNVAGRSVGVSCC